MFESCDNSWRRCHKEGCNFLELDDDGLSEGSGDSDEQILTAAPGQEIPAERAQNWRERTPISTLPPSAAERASTATFPQALDHRRSTVGSRGSVASAASTYEAHNLRRSTIGPLPSAANGSMIGQVSQAVTPVQSYVPLPTASIQRLAPQGTAATPRHQGHLGSLRELAPMQTAPNASYEPLPTGWTTSLAAPLPVPSAPNPSYEPLPTGWTTSLAAPSPVSTAPSPASAAMATAPLSGYSPPDSNGVFVSSSAMATAPLSGYTPPDSNGFFVPIGDSYGSFVPTQSIETQALPAQPVSTEGLPTQSMPTQAFLPRGAPSQGLHSQGGSFETQPSPFFPGSVGPADSMERTASMKSRPSVRFANPLSTGCLVDPSKPQTIEPTAPASSPGPLIQPLSTNAHVLTVPASMPGLPPSTHPQVAVAPASLPGPLIQPQVTPAWALTAPASMPGPLIQPLSTHAQVVSAPVSSPGPLIQPLSAHPLAAQPRSAGSCAQQAMVPEGVVATPAQPLPTGPVPWFEVPSAGPMATMSLEPVMSPRLAIPMAGIAEARRSLGTPSHRVPPLDPSRAQCQNPDCPNPTWDGEPGFCSVGCSRFGS